MQQPLVTALLPHKTASGRESCLGWKKCVADARLSDVSKEGESYNFRWSAKLWSPISPIAHLPAPLRGSRLFAFSQVVLVCCSCFCYVPPLTLPRKITSTHTYFFLHVERDWYKQRLLQILAVDLWKPRGSSVKPEGAGCWAPSLLHHQHGCRVFRQKGSVPDYATPVHVYPYCD